MNPLNQVITAQEAAELLFGASTPTTKRQVQRLCKTGKLLHRSAPGGLLIDLQSVEDYKREE